MGLENNCARVRCAAAEVGPRNEQSR